MSTQRSDAVRAPRARIERIALGSDRAAKIMAVRASIARVAEVDSGWREATVVARSGVTAPPAMPFADWGVVSGGRQRAPARKSIARASVATDSVPHRAFRPTRI